MQKRSRASEGEPWVMRKEQWLAPGRLRRKLSSYDCAGLRCQCLGKVLFGLHEHQVSRLGVRYAGKPLDPDRAITNQE
jgi:hypothetical protein